MTAGPHKGAERFACLPACVFPSSAAGRIWWGEFKCESRVVGACARALLERVPLQAGCHTIAGCPCNLLLASETASCTLLLFFYRRAGGYFNYHHSRPSSTSSHAGVAFCWGSLRRGNKGCGGSGGRRGLDICRLAALCELFLLSWHGVLQQASQLWIVLNGFVLSGCF